MKNYKCPYCGSDRVVERPNEFQCLSCGSIDSDLYDYPVHKPECDPIEEPEETETRVVHTYQQPLNTIKEIKRLENEMQEHFRSHTNREKGKLPIYDKYKNNII